MPTTPPGVFGIVRDKLVGLLRRAVEDRDLEAVVGDVEGEVLAHDREANEPDVGKWFSHRPANLPAAGSKTKQFLSPPTSSPRVVACFVS